MTTITTGIDIDTFRSLSREDRAIRWRTYTYETRFELCRETLRAMGRRFDSDTVMEAIDHWDRKFAAAAPTAIPAPLCYAREIVYSPETKDYAMYLNGELIGFARTHHDAEVTIDELVRSTLTHAAPEPAPVPDALDRDCRPIPRCFDCDAVLGDYGRCEECDDRAYAATAPVALAPLYCPCGNRALILEPHGAFCGPCDAAQADVSWGS